MHKKFEINQTNIKGGCQSGRKVLLLDSKSDLPLADPMIPPKFPDIPLDSQFSTFQDPHRI